MSRKASDWAWDQKVSSVSERIVLVALSDYAHPDTCECHPSISALEEKTCLERKTIFRTLGRLKEAGLIEDTGQRIGRTKQIAVYRVKVFPNGNSSKSGTVPLFPAKSSQMGTRPYSTREPVKEHKREARASSLSAVVEYAHTISVPKSDAEHFWDSQEAGGWKRGGKPIADWKACLRTWKSGGWLPSQKNGNGKHSSPIASEKKSMANGYYSNSSRLFDKDGNPIKI